MGIIIIRSKADIVLCEFKADLADMDLSDAAPFSWRGVDLR